MADYLPICAAIVGLTEAAVAANTVVAGVGGDWPVPAFQLLAFGTEAASVAYYFKRVRNTFADVEVGTRQLETAKKQTRWGDPLPMAQGSLLVLASAAGLIEAVLMLNGFEYPDRGDDFKDGSRTFAVDITHLLAEASATDWHSDAAQKYSDHNGYQENRVGWMAAADRAIAHAVARQGHEVEAVRQELAGIVAGLAATTLVAVELYRKCLYERTLALSAFKNPTAMAVAAQWWQSAWSYALALAALVTATVAAAVGSVIYLLYHLMDEVTSRTRHRLHQARDQYQSVVDDVRAKQPTAIVPAVGLPRVPPSAGADVGNFADFGGLAGDLFSAPDQVGAAGGVRDQPQAVAASVGSAAGGRPSQTSGSAPRPFGRTSRPTGPAAGGQADEQDTAAEAAAPVDETTLTGPAPVDEATFAGPAPARPARA